MAPILAVARVTLQESVRKRIFLVMVFFGLFLVASSAFFPALDAAGRVRLVVGWGLNSTTLFGLLLVVFLTSLSLPQDIEEKKVYMLITKPLSRPSLFLGKFLGFAVFLAVFLAVTGGLALAYARIVAWQAGPAAEEALAVRDQLESPVAEVHGERGAVQSVFTEDEPARVWASGPTSDFAAWNFRGILFSPDPPGCIGRFIHVKVRVHTRPRGPGAGAPSGPGPMKLRVMAYKHTGSQPESLLDAFQWNEVDDGDAIELWIPKDRFDPQDGDMRVALMAPIGGPMELGASPLDATAFLVNRYPGPTDEVEYRWDSLSAIVGSGYHENRAMEEVEALFNVHSRKYGLTVKDSPPLFVRWSFPSLDPDDFDDRATLDLRLPIKGPAFSSQTEVKAGYVTVTVRRPDGTEVFRQKLRVPTNKLVPIPFDRKWIVPGQRLDVDLERGERDTVFSLVPDGVTLRTHAKSFAGTYVRALALVWLEMMLLLAIVLPCSTRLSGPVSLFVGIALFLCGLFLDSINENLFQLNSIIRTTEVLEKTVQGEERHHLEEDIPLPVLKVSSFLLGRVVVPLFPQLDRFDAGRALQDGVGIPFSRIAWTAGYVALYALVTSAIGMLILRFREFR